MRSQLAAEEARLKLREVEARHRELDEREEARRREFVAAAERLRAQEEAEQRRQLQADRERARAAEDAAREAMRARRRRRAAQSIRDEVMEGPAELVLRVMGDVPSEARAEASAAIDRELSGLDVVRAPRHELVAVAARARDRVYQPLIDATDRRRARKDHLVGVGLELVDRELRARAERDEEKDARRREKLGGGRPRVAALLEIRADNQRAQSAAFAGFDRLRIAGALKARLTGDETRADVEQLVDELLP